MRNYIGLIHRTYCNYWQIYFNRKQLRGIMRFFIFITLIISLFIFSGCGKIVLMKGPDGDIRECKGEYGFGGQIGAIMAANACVEEYEKVGYKRVE